MQEKKWVTITGMERSGTSMLSKILIDSGVCMTHTNELDPDLCDPSFLENTLKHFEDYEGLVLNEDIINSGCLPSEDHILKIKEYIEKRKNDFSTYDLIGFKDPRLSLLYQHWDSLIDVKKIIIFTRRSPYSTIKSRIAGGSIKPLEEEFNMWKEYNESVDKLIKLLDIPIISVIYEYFLYDYLYRNNIIKKIESELKINLDISSINIGMDHSGIDLIKIEEEIF